MAVSDTDDEADFESSVEDSEDLKHMIQLLKTLRVENNELRNNFDNLKSLHIQLTLAHQDLEAKHSSLQTERVHVERQYQHLCDSWRVELEEKQKQFDQVKAQILQPRDLELLRVQLLDEVEGPFKMKCEILTQEAEAAQENFVKLRREHEALQNEHHAMEQRFKGEVAALQSEHDVDTRVLKEKLQLMGQPHARATQLEVRVRQLEREKGEVSTMLEHLREECEDLRKQKQRAVQEKDQAVARAERQRKEAQAGELEAQSIVDSQSRKVRHLQKELSTSMAAQESMHSQLMSMQAQLSSQSAHLDEQRRVHSMELSALTAQLEACEQRVQEKAEELNQKLAEAAEEALKLSASHRQQLDEAEDAHRAALREAEDRLAARSRVLAEEKGEVAARLAALEAQVAADKERADWRKEERESVGEELHAVMRGVAAAQQEAAAARGQLEASQQQCASLQQEVVELRGLNEGLKRDILRVEGGQSPDMMRWRDMEVRCEQLEGRSKELGGQLAERTQELAEVRRALESEQAEWQRCMRSSKAAWAVEKSAAVKHCQEQLRGLRETHVGEVKRWKHRLKRAKHSITALQQQLTSLRVEVAEAQDGHSALQLLRMSCSSDPGGLLRPHSAGYSLRPGSPLALAVTASPRVYYSLDRPPSRSAEDLALKMGELRQRQEGYLD